MAFFCFFFGWVEGGNMLMAHSSRLHRRLLLVEAQDETACALLKYLPRSYPWQSLLPGLRLAMLGFAGAAGGA